MSEITPETLSSDKPFYTISELVQMGISRSSWYNHHRAGRIRFKKMSGRTVCLRADLDAFLNALPDVE